MKLNDVSDRRYSTDLAGHVERITDWLKQCDQESETCKVFSIKDEPYEQMGAEWQDWGDARAKLFVGYWYELADDFVPDPNIAIDLKDGQITGVVVNTLFGPFRCLSTEDQEYVAGVLSTIYDRHMANRIVAKGATQ